MSRRFNCSYSMLSLPWHFQQFEAQRELKTRGIISWFLWVLTISSGRFFFSKRKLELGDTAQWWSPCLTCTRSWVQSLLSPCSPQGESWSWGARTLQDSGLQLENQRRNTWFFYDLRIQPRTRVWLDIKMIMRLERVGCLKNRGSLRRRIQPPTILRQGAGPLP